MWLHVFNLALKKEKQTDFFELKASLIYLVKFQVSQGYISRLSKKHNQ